MLCLHLVQDVFQVIIEIGVTSQGCTRKLERGTPSPPAITLTLNLMFILMLCLHLVLDVFLVIVGSGVTSWEGHPLPSSHNLNTKPNVYPYASHHLVLDVSLVIVGTGVTSQVCTRRLERGTPFPPAITLTLTLTLIFIHILCLYRDLGVSQVIVGTGVTSRGCTRGLGRGTLSPPASGSGVGQWTQETRPGVTNDEGWQFAVDFPR